MQVYSLVDERKCKWNWNKKLIENIHKGGDWSEILMRALNDRFHQNERACGFLKLLARSNFNINLQLRVDWTPFQRIPLLFFHSIHILEIRRESETSKVIIRRIWLAISRYFNLVTSKWKIFSLFSMRLDEQNPLFWRRYYLFFSNILKKFFFNWVE